MRKMTCIPVRPAAAHSPEGLATQPAALPAWDLSDLYPAADSPLLAADLDAADVAAGAFNARYAGTLPGLSGADLAATLAEYERIEEILGRVMSFAQLKFSGDSTDAAIGRFMQSCSERVTAISAHLIFFSLELNRLDDSVLERQASDPALARWQPFLRDLRVFRSHQLSDEAEKLLHDKSVTGAQAWSRLFDETVAGMRIPFGDTELTVSDTLNKLSDRDRATREKAGHAIGTAFGERVKLFGLITNTLAKDKAISDTWRHYPRPGSSRNRSNMVEDEVVDALVTAITGDYGRLSHRYYTMKAKWLGLPKLQHWDRNAPLARRRRPRHPLGRGPQPRARRIRRVQPRIGRCRPPFLRQALDRRRPAPRQVRRRLRPPDRAVRAPLPAAELSRPHPRRDDPCPRTGPRVSTRCWPRSRATCSPAPPLTLAETASVFGEMLTFRALLDAETDPARRRIMLASKVEDMLNTVVRQTAFYRFETLVHDERRTGELLPERIGAIWRQVQTESLGPVFEFLPEYDVFLGLRAAFRALAPSTSTPTRSATAW